MKTLISFFAKQNNEVSINHFNNFALSQALMNSVRGGDGDDEDTQTPPAWFIPEN